MKWLLLALMIPVGAPLARAGLEFSQTLKEIHVEADAKTATVDFDFKNTGKSPVDVKKYESTCSCMAVQIKGSKLHYEPGESGVVRTIFELGNFSGPTDKLATIWVNDDKEDEPSVKLTTRIVIPVLIEMSQKTVKWELGSEPKPQTIHIKMTDAKPMKILEVSCTNPAFHHELKTVEEGRQYDLEISPENTKQVGLGVIRIETDSKIARFHVQTAFAQVSRPMVGTPPSAPSAGSANTQQPGISQPSSGKD